MDISLLDKYVTGEKERDFLEKEIASRSLVLKESVEYSGYNDKSAGIFLPAARRYCLRLETPEGYLFGFFIGDVATVQFLLDTTEHVQFEHELNKP